MITDLRQRGLLEDALIIWGENLDALPWLKGSGRDHHIQGYGMFMAGGGVKGGTTYGATDELGYNAEKGSGARSRPARYHVAPTRHRPYPINRKVSKAWTAALPGVEKAPRGQTDLSYS